MIKGRIAVLMACYNRCESTLCCLEALYNQSVDDVELDVYLVDDGCTDGTGEAVRSRFPEVRVVAGDGNLYWCGGMRVAFSEAMKGDYDYYFWLNDDTVLLPGALQGLLETAHEFRQSQGREGIIVGSACDSQTSRLTYGGRVQTSRWRPMNFKTVTPSEEPQRCDTMNGNCVLIPRRVADLVGNLSADFTHSMGDTDYGLRAKAMGVGIWVAPNYAAECSGNKPSLWVNPATPLMERLRILHSPKGLPFRERLVYTKRHWPIRWPIYCVQVYLRVLFPRFWGWLKS